MSALFLLLQVIPLVHPRIPVTIWNPTAEVSEVSIVQGLVAQTMRLGPRSVTAWYPWYAAPVRISGAESEGSVEEQYDWSFPGEKDRLVVIANMYSFETWVEVRHWITNPGTSGPAWVASPPSGVQRGSEWVRVGPRGGTAFVELPERGLLTIHAMVPVACTLLED